MAGVPSFVDGLVNLSAAETRKRLASALAEARIQADWTAGPAGDAIAEAIRHVDSVLLESARWAVQRIDTALSEAQSAPRHVIVATRPATMEEHHAAVVAALDSDEPWPNPPRARPPLPSLRAPLPTIPRRS